MSVRVATPDDADAIERVRTDTWRDAYRGLMPDALLDRLGYDGSRRREMMRQQQPDRFVLVADHDGVVVGFANGGPSRSTELPYAGEIYAIYVLPEHQGHGHGASLMRAGARELVSRGMHTMVVWVLRENEPARTFYERMGGRHLAGRDEERAIDGVAITEAAYAWDQLSALARGA